VRHICETIKEKEAKEEPIKMRGRKTESRSSDFCTPRAGHTLYKPLLPDFIAPEKRQQRPKTAAGIPRD